MSRTSSTSRVAVIDRVHQALVSLGLPEMDGVVETRLEQATRQEQAYGEFLAELLETEVQARRERYLRTRMRLAHLPAVKTLEQFDFGFQPSIDERQIRELQTLRFVSEGSNVILLGPPGVGKTGCPLGAWRSRSRWRRCAPGTARTSSPPTIW